MKYNKVRGILRVKQGSQIPKFESPSDPLPKPNPNIIGVINPISKPDALDIPLSNIGLPIFTGSKMKLMGEKFALGAKNFIQLNGMSIANAGLDMLGSSFNNVENSGGINTAFAVGDTIANGIGMVNPVFGLAAKGVMTAVKGINSLGGKRAKKFSINLATAAQVGASYGGSMTDITNAANKAGKKYGLFSGGSRRKANNLIDEAVRQQNIMTDIANEASDMQAMAGNDLNYTNYLFDINGGYDQRYMRAAKSGMKLLDKIDFVKLRKTINNFINLDTKEIEWEPIIDDVEKFKEGGVFPHHVDNSSINYPVCELIWEPEIELFEEWEPVIELEIFQEGGPIKKSFEEWFISIPKDSRASGYDYKKAYEVLDWETLHNHTKDPEKYHLYSVSPIADENGNYPFLKLGKIENNPEIQGEFDWYNSKEGAEHKSKFDILFINDRYYYVPKKFKDGGKAKEELETPEIEETNQKNLIPEGALHKNKHHMEHTEGLTQKGIPVIDNDGEQLAEIELDEIIFTLEVTKKLEELYKDGSDEAAIEAGKLLVKEILFNTDDRTGLISKCEKGGKICQIEE